MYTLMIIFGVVALIGGVLTFGKLNFFQFTGIALVLALLIIFLPAFIQHSSITKGMELYKRDGDSKIYYSEAENQYYEVERKNGWVPWDMYDVKALGKVNFLD